MGPTCQGIAGTVDIDLKPTSVTWGGTPGNPATDRYRVEFITSARTMDTAADGADNQLGTAPRMYRRLDLVAVESKPAGAIDFQLIRDYAFTYADAASAILSDESLAGGLPDPTTTKLTLTQIGWWATTAPRTCRRRRYLRDGPRHRPDLSEGVVEPADAGGQRARRQDRLHL